jgi:signal peptidase I
LLAGALVVGALIRGVKLQGYFVESQSMSPTLLAGDHVLVNKLAFGLRLPWSREPAIEWALPRRGDVVLYDFRAEQNPGFARRIAGDGRSALPLVKRVVALPGDSIEVRDGRLLVNGREEGIGATGNVSESTSAYAEVPPRKMFVVGDNRSRSTDSRQLGFVSQDALVGRVELIYWSTDPAAPRRPRWSRLGRPVR